MKKSNRNKSIFFVLCAILISSLSSLFAEEHLPSKLIDTPINNFYKPNEFGYDMTMYKNGGIVNWFEMGIKPGFNLGFSIDFFKIIGDENMTTREPRISARLNVYKGSLYVPAFHVGYLGQGYGESVNGVLENEEKGFYVAAEKELFLPLFMWNFGLNMCNFKDRELYGFVNARYPLFDKLLVMFEYDNIRVAPNARINLGFKYYITDNLSMGLGVRKLNRISKNEEPVERIFLITYVGRFRILDR